ncbi:MAG: (2Fe-2S)-binding protein [Thermoproteota archaeon]|nr:(2Fe-2S)-binding protein [Thermoproteota archaeon]
MSQKTVRLVIDGKEVHAAEDETILKVALENEIDIPTMCYLEGLSGLGGCRLCLVEAKGMSKLFPACTTPVSNGMEITTNSERLLKHRKKVIELLLSERTHICSVCVANGSCELQEMATRFGVDHVPVVRRWTGFELDMSHERFVIDRNRCILCTRCIRVCDEIEGVHTLDLKMRGKDAQVIMDLDEPWASSYSCTSCSKCSAVCPVGAIYIKGKSLAETKNRALPEFVFERRKR